MKGVECFFDTNILIYFSTDTDKVKQQIAAVLIDDTLACGAKTLYSEGVQPGQHIDSLTIINPFVA